MLFRSVRFVDMPDGVDHVDIARLHAFRQCRHQFGDGFGFPAGVYKTAYVIHRQLPGLDLVADLVSVWDSLIADPTSI